VIWLDLIENPHFVRLPERVFVLLEIFLRHGVDVLVGTIACTFCDVTAHFQIPIRIIRVQDRERHAPVALQILIFLAALGGVFPESLA
jgi:hypothetical protein